MISLTVYEYDGTEHQLETRNEWGLECRETIQTEDGYYNDWWYHDRCDGTYLREDELVTLYDPDICLYCGKWLPWAGVNPPSVPAADDDDAWADLAPEHAQDCEWVATRAHQLDS